ncbi:MAG: phospholipid methyltransferase [Planctomycetota bacterium]|nr:phospholipid methyltransferase [Planctomycetota bacterium]
MTDRDPTQPALVRRSRPVRDGFGFLAAFLSRPKSVGAVLPSSRFLARALVGSLDLQPGELVVEFGPGTGPMTEVIQERLPPGARYLGIELEERFHELLVQRFPELDFHLGSAAELPALLADRDLPKPVRIISGLPFASLPAAVQDGVIGAVTESLAPGADFRTFQYVHAYRLAAARRFRSLMAGRFTNFERIGPVIRNVPPAYVLRYYNEA